jgi:hypothetical protein
VALHFNFKKIFKALNFQACFHAEEMILFVWDWQAITIH